MNSVNWWLMTLAFVLGMLLAFVTMIRRVKREVPIHRAAGGVGVSGRAATARFASGRADAGTQTTEMPVTEGDSPSRPATTGAAAGAGVAGSVARFAGGDSATEPHAPRSVRAIPGGGTPAGYPIKANEDAMAYHTPDSPSFDHAIADIWFKDEQSAVGAGFTRWDSVGTDEVTAKTPAREDDSTTKLAPADAVGAAGAAAAAARVTGSTSEDKPYGTGSVRVAAGTRAPQGYTIKGNENSMLYHTPDSPSYAQTIAEVWFQDEESAVHAGFTPWHEGRKTR